MKAKQSFINAGYQKAEVEAAARKGPAGTQQISKQVATTAPKPYENDQKRIIMYISISNNASNTAKRDLPRNVAPMSLLTLLNSFIVTIVPANFV